MNIIDVANWLKNISLDEYIELFEYHEISGDTICDLTDEDLQNIGIKNSNHRNRILSSICLLERNSPRDYSVKIFYNRKIYYYLIKHSRSYYRFMIDMYSLIGNNITIYFCINNDSSNLIKIVDPKSYDIALSYPITHILISNNIT